MPIKAKFLILVAAAVAALVAGVGVGSVSVPPEDIFAVLANRIAGFDLPQDLNPIYPGLVFDIRLPRVMLAFFAGAALSVSGAVMQSLLRNPLASPYGLGISAGAGLGAALVMVSGVSVGILGAFLLPAVGLLFAAVTVVFVMAFSSRIDKDLSNTTVVLTGMVISLFLSAIITTIAAMFPDHTQRIVLWQLGTFSSKEWGFVFVLAFVGVLCTIYFVLRSSELDVLTFGEEQAAGLGVDVKRAKIALMGGITVLTGTAVSFVGIIGFVDLVAPHVVRRFFGSSHRYVIPACALAGGAFMVLCDLAARTLIAPSEIPIGSITALIGAPFFIYVFLRERKKAR